MDHTQKKDHRWPLLLMLLVAGYLLHRGLTLYTAFDTLCIHPYEVMMANIGQLALMGFPGAPLHQFYDNCGGHLMTGLLAAPLFEVFGPTYLTLKLVPVTLGLLTLLVLWKLMDRHFSRTAANIAGLLFVLGPPTLVKFSMLAMGNHFENLFFQLVMVWAFYSMHASERKNTWLAIFGFLTGCSITIYFGTLVTLSVLAVTHVLIRGWRALPKDLLVASGPLLLGLAPTFWLHSQTIGRPGKMLSNWSEVGDPLARVQELVVDLLPRSGTYAAVNPELGTSLERTYLLLFAVTWLVLVSALLRSARQLRHQGASERARFEAYKALPLVGYLPAFIAFYGISSFRFSPYGPPIEAGQFRYLVPHFCMAALVIGAGLQGLLRSPHRRVRHAGLAFTLLAVLTATGPLQMVDLGAPEVGVGSHYRAYDYVHYNNALMRDSQKDPDSGNIFWDMDQVRLQFSEFGQPESHFIAMGIGYHLAAAQHLTWTKDRAGSPGLQLAPLYAEFDDKSVHPSLACGAGMYVRKIAFSGAAGRAAFQELLGTLIEEGHDLSDFVEGLCIGRQFPLSRLTEAHLRRTRNLGTLLPQQLKPYWEHGYGMRCGLALARGLEQDALHVAKHSSNLNPKRAPGFWYGVGRGFAHYLEDPDCGERLAQCVPADFLERAQAGYTEAREELLGVAKVGLAARTPGVGLETRAR